MTQSRNKGFMPNGKNGSPEWIEELLAYHRENPDGDAEEILFQAMHTDSLTGVLARSGIEHVIDQIEESRTPTGVAFFDLMDFKQINDEIGHDAGDRAISYTANTLAKILRTGKTGDRRQSERIVFQSGPDRRSYSLKEDIVFNKLVERSEVGRMGGDEFLVLLPRVRTYAALENIGFRVADAINSDPDCQPTSIGFALYQPDKVGMAETIAHADKAMYAAKKELKLDKKERNLSRSESGFGIHQPDKDFKIYLPGDIKSKKIA